MTEPTQTSATASSTESVVHRSQETMDLPYAVIKMFSDFGCLAGKPLAPAAVEELSSFWGRIQQLVSTKQFSVALAKRCVAGTAHAARTLSGDSPRIDGVHLREAISMVRAEATGMAGIFCRTSLG